MSGLQDKDFRRPSAVESHVAPPVRWLGIGIFSLLALAFVTKCVDEGGRQHGCITDTECMEQEGGDGGPEPMARPCTTDAECMQRHGGDVWPGSVEDDEDDLPITWDI